MNKVTRAGILIAAIIVLTVSVFAQKTRPTPKASPSPTPVPTPTPTPPPTLPEILVNAQAQSETYREAFKNLLANETKSFEIYDKKGGVKKRRTVTSNFIVYQLSKDTDRIAEYRNVIAVDGKPLEKTDVRAQQFFEKIAQAESSSAELDEIEKESLRFDGDLLINGLALFQALALNPNLRPAFDFNIEGNQTIDGSEVYVISYRQMKASPDIVVNSKEPTKTGRISYDVEVDREVPLNGLMRGRLFIDASTFRLWREEREMTIQPEGFSAPLVVVREDLDYQRGDFDILVPKKLVHTHYRVKIKDMTAAKEMAVTFDYTKFTKPDVEVKSADIK